MVLVALVPDAGSGSRLGSFPSSGRPARRPVQTASRPMARRALARRSPTLRRPVSATPSIRDEQRQRDVQLVASTVSHELRNAITPALAYAQLLTRRADELPPDLRSLLERAFASLERTADRIDALSDAQAVREHVWPGGRRTLELRAAA